MTEPIYSVDFEIGKIDIAAYEEKTQKKKDAEIKKKVAKAEKRKGK